MDRIGSFSVYAGIGASLCLSVAAQLHLHRHVGSFGIEAAFWMPAIFLGTMGGWLYNRHSWSVMATVSKVAAIVAFLMLIPFLLSYFPVRAMIFFLAAIQVSRCFVLTTRRDLYFACLLSGIIIFSAVGHIWADWTLIAFFVVPYSVAMTYTLMADHADRCRDRLRSLVPAEGSPATASWGGVALVGLLLMSGSLLVYAVLPQPLPAHVSAIPNEYGPGSVSAGNTGAGDGSGAAGSGGAMPSGGGIGAFIGGNLELKLGQLRELAGRTELPAWLGDALEYAASLGERLAAALGAAARQLPAVPWRWLLLALALLALAYLLYAKNVAGYVRVKLDKWLLRSFMRGDPSVAIAECYRAMQRICAYHGCRRAPTANTSEYLKQIVTRFDALSPSMGTLTDTFDRARYGALPPRPADAETAYRAYLDLELLFSEGIALRRKPA